MKNVAPSCSLLISLLVCCFTSLPTQGKEYEPDSWFIRNCKGNYSNCWGYEPVSCTVNGKGPIKGMRFEIGDGTEFHWSNGLSSTVIRYYPGDGSVRDFFGRKWKRVDSTYSSLDGRHVLKCKVVGK